MAPPSVGRPKAATSGRFLLCVFCALCGLIYRPCRSESGGIGRRAGLRIQSRKGWGFESPLSHTKKTRRHEGCTKEQSMNNSTDATVLHTVRTRLVKDFSQQIRECLTALTQEQIWWRPNEGANSVGNLVLHLTGSTRFYVLECLTGESTNRNRPQEFAERTEIPKDKLIQLLDQLIGEIDSTLSAMQPEDMTRTTDRTGKESTYAQIVIHVLGHFAAHTGQILYVTKMLQEGAINELWMKFRK